MKKNILFLAVFIFFVHISGCAPNDDMANIPGDKATNDEPSLSDDYTPDPTPTLLETGENLQAAEETDPYGNPITWDDDASNFPLYAMIQSEDIYLYGLKPFGMVLYKDGNAKYFDWPGLTPRRVLPEMLYHDFDGDGKRDLAVILYVSSGTSCAMMDLHILTIEEDEHLSRPIYTDHFLLALDANEWMQEEIKIALSDDGNSFKMDFYGNSYMIDCYNDSETGSLIGVGFGDIVYFMFEGNRIKTKIALGTQYENFASPLFFGTIEANVVFDGINFRLEDYTFTLNI